MMKMIFVRPVTTCSLVIGLLSITVLAGCGGDGITREAVAGKVSLDGQPLPTGHVTFVPLDGQTAASVEVCGGVFQADRASGPAPGRYQVEIVSVQQTGKTIPHPDLYGETIHEERSLIPPRYNVKSELLAEVRANDSNEYEFALYSEQASTKRSRRR